VAEYTTRLPSVPLPDTAGGGPTGERTRCFSVEQPANRNAAAETIKVKRTESFIDTYCLPLIRFMFKILKEI
jgi:hypothetical protein